jgi:hypothetical protein
MRIPQVVHDGRKPKADLPCLQDLRRQPKIHQGQMQMKDILGIIFFIAITIALLHSVKSCVDTDRASQIQNSTLYLYINDKPVCRGLQGFNGRVYSFTCSDGTKYKGLTNFYTRNHK